MVGDRAKWAGSAADGEEAEDDEAVLKRKHTGKDVRTKIAPALAKVAQEVYDKWDESDVDCYAGGGICHFIAEEMAGALQSEGIEANTVSQQIGEQHVYVVAKLKDGVYAIDIPPSTYETGGGYSWKKIPDVAITKDDIVVDKIDGDPDSYGDYIEMADVLALGGPGSGHHGHESVLGQKGGSAPGKGTKAQLDPKSKETWYRTGGQWHESPDGERPYGWDWPPDGEAYEPPTVAHTMIRGSNAGLWGGSHHGSRVITGDAAQQMGIDGYRDLDATTEASTVATRMLTAIATDRAGSEEALFHTFENVQGTVFRPGDTMRLPLMAAAGKPETGYATRLERESQTGMPTVFAFPKGTPMVGYSTTTKKDLEDLDMPTVEAQHKEQGFVWDEAIVAGGFEVERVETVYMGSQHTGTPMRPGEQPQLYGQVVHLKPTEVFNPTTGKWTKRG